MLKEADARDIVEAMQEMRSLCAKVEKDADKLAKMRSDETAREVEEEKREYQRLRDKKLKPVLIKKKTNEDDLRRGKLYKCSGADEGPERDNICRMLSQKKKPGRLADILQHIERHKQTAQQRKYKAYAGAELSSWTDVPPPGGRRSGDKKNRNR